MSGQLMMVKVEDLVPTYTKETNPNRMTDLEFESLVRVMKAKGAVQTILIYKMPQKKGPTKYKIHDGHHRLWAAERVHETNPELLRELPAFLYNSKGEAEAALIGLGLNRIRGEQDLARAGQVMQDVMEKTKMSIDTASLLTGYGVEELQALTTKASTDADDLLEDLGDAGATGLDEEIQINSKPFVLEIVFTDRDKFRLARRRLRKAAGKSKDLAVGLLSLLGEEDES